MKPWSLAAAAVVVLKLANVIAFGWFKVGYIAVLLMFAPLIIVFTAWAATVALFLVLMGVVMVVGWLLDNIFKCSGRAQDGAAAFIKKAATGLTRFFNEQRIRSLK